MFLNAPRKASELIIITCSFAGFSESSLIELITKVAGSVDIDFNPKNIPYESLPLAFARQLILHINASGIDVIVDHLPTR